MRVDITHTYRTYLCTPRRTTQEEEGGGGNEAIAALPQVCGIQGLNPSEQVSSELLPILVGRWCLMRQ